MQFSFKALQSPPCNPPSPPRTFAGPPSYYNGMPPSSYASPPRRRSPSPLPAAAAAAAAAEPTAAALSKADARRIAMLQLFLASPVVGQLPGPSKRTLAALLLQKSARGRASRYAFSNAKTVAQKVQATMRGRTARAAFALQYDALVDARDDRHLLKRRGERAVLQSKDSRRESSWAYDKIFGNKAP